MAKASEKTEVAVPAKGFDVAKFRVGIANVKAVAKVRAGFLKMDREGEWSYGQDNTVVEEGDKFYIDPAGFVYGWQCWRDTSDGAKAEVLGTVAVAIDKPLPEQPDKVPEGGKGWDEMRGLSLVHNGKPLTYSATSLGGLDAIQAFLAEFSAHLDEDEGTPIACVTLGSDWYKNKKFGGKTYVPVFSVQDWVGELPKDAVAPVPKKALANGKAKTPLKRTAKA